MKNVGNICQCGSFSYTVSLPRNIIHILTKTVKCSAHSTVHVFPSVHVILYQITKHDWQITETNYVNTIWFLARVTEKKRTNSHVQRNLRSELVDPKSQWLATNYSMYQQAYLQIVEIWGSHGEYVDCGLLGFVSLKMEVIGTIQTSVATYRTTRCYNAHDHKGSLMLKKSQIVLLSLTLN
jgi:hypothetical protein